MKRIQIFQGDILVSIEMIRSGIFINCDLSGIMGHVHALQVRSSNLLLEKRVNHFKHSNLRHGTCNQPRRGNFHVCFCSIAQLYDDSLLFHLHIQHGNLWNLGCHTERERELFILLRHARINMFCDMMCTCRWCGFVHIETYFYCPLQLYRPWTCVQTLE